MDERLYGPVKIGGPCEKCGVAQVEHVGRTCEEAKQEQGRALRGALSKALEKAQETPKRKATYIGAPACFALEQACQQIVDAFGHYGIYQVGSSLERPDWRDIDLRYILPDEEFAKLFPNAEDHWEQDPRWLLLTVSISGWLSKQTGLPVDFQFQPQTHANARHKGPRNAYGMRIQTRSGHSARLSGDAE